MTPSVPIGAYLKVSFIDWTGHVAPVLFLCGCNFRCPYCHNAPLLDMGSGILDPCDVYQDINRRDQLLDGIVISGGEPTIHEDLPAFLKDLRAFTGLPLKLDTNGSRPLMLVHILENELVDAVSLDVKAPWDQYEKIVRGDGRKVMASLNILGSSGKPFETRTTYVPGLMGIEDLEKIRAQIGGGVPWIIQPFRPGVTLDPYLGNTASPDREELKEAFPDAIVR